MLTEIQELQKDAVSKLIEEIKKKSKKSYTFKAPTGSGKTYMMADFMNRMFEINNDIIFLVSSLSKSDLARQNYEKFCEYKNINNFKNLNPYLISSDISGEERLFIPSDFNVYLLPRDLYKRDSRLMRGSFVNFLMEMRYIENKTIIWIKDECHITTSNLDSIASTFFTITVNFSATPKLPKGQYPDVEITEEEAENARLIKHVVWGEDDDTVRVAIEQFKKIKSDYRNLLGVNPCLIIQISNKEKADEELKSEIMPILNNNPELKWMLIVNDPKECDTNDVFKAKKMKVDRWKDYAKSNLSGIDIIIFKLVISEGWNIPRACMFYQARNSRSKQLDEQVIGRVRRNPRLLDFETLSEDAKNLATTAWIWGISKTNKNKNYRVKLKEKEIQNKIKVKTTKLKTLENKVDFNLENFLSKQKNILTHKSIFEINRQLKSVDSTTKEIIYNYATDYEKWWQVAEYIQEIELKNKQYMCDYSKSMILEDESSFGLSSYYSETDKYVNINNWIWKRVDGNNNFSFDSDAEKNWVNILKDISFSSIMHTTINKNKNIYTENINLFENREIISKINEEEKIFLWGKNYVPESSIKFEYYLNGLHASFPDFIMEDKFGRIHIFEIKSVNQSFSFDFDKEKYINKVDELKKCYKQASKMTGHYFYLPIMKKDIWEIILFINGEEKRITIEQFKEIILKNE